MRTMGWWERVGGDVRRVATRKDVAAIRRGGSYFVTFVVVVAEGIVGVGKGGGEGPPRGRGGSVEELG